MILTNNVNSKLEKGVQRKIWENYEEMKVNKLGELRGNEMKVN